MFKGKTKLGQSVDAAIISIASYSDGQKDVYKGLGSAYLLYSTLR
jgi:hypothetical protein